MDISVAIHTNHTIVTRDGVALAGDLYLPTPHDGRRKSVVLYRTPYGKDRLTNDFLAPLDAAAAGFAAYVQDIRGFGRSGGSPNFMRWEGEADDAHDTLEHLAHEPWSSGAAGMAGASFQGMLQLAALHKRHPSLKAIAPAMVTAHPFERAATAPLIRFSETFLWIARMLVATALREVGGDAARLPEAQRRLAGRLAHRAELFQVLHDEGLPPDLLAFGDGALARLMDGGLDPYTPGRLFERMEVPALVTTGWYDTFALPSAALGRAWATGPAGARSRTYIGPWSHSNALPMNVGQVNFDANATGGAMGVPQQHARFFAAALDGRDEHPAPSTEYVLFGGRWADADEPAAGALDIPLAPVRGAADLSGEADLTPTLGGQSHFNAGGVPGPIDQRQLLRRSDSALLQSSPVTEEIELRSLRLHLERCDGTQGAVVAKLCVIDPTDVVLPVQEGVFALADVAASGALSFAPCRFRVRRGWRIGVLVSLGSYPRLLDPSRVRVGQPLGAGASAQRLGLAGPFRLSSQPP